MAPPDGWEVALQGGRQQAPELDRVPVSHGSAGNLWHFPPSLPPSLSSHRKAGFLPVIVKPRSLVPCSVCVGIPMQPGHLVPIKTQSTNALVSQYHHHHHHHLNHLYHHHYPRHFATVPPYMQKAGDSWDISPQIFLDFPQNFRLRTRSQYCTQAIA